MAGAAQMSTDQSLQIGSWTYRTVDGDCPYGHVVLVGLDREVGHGVGHEFSELLQESAIYLDGVVWNRGPLDTGEP